MKIADVQEFINNFCQLSDIKLIIPVSEKDVLALKKEVQDSGFCCMIECSAMNPFQLVITDKLKNDIEICD